MSRIANVVVCLDKSGSTAERMQGVPKLEAEIRGVEVFLGAKARVQRHDRIAGLVFDDAPHVVFAWTAPTSPWVMERLRRQQPGGTTNLTLALQLAVRML